MQCAITGQTVVTRHYAVFRDDDGDSRYYALASPPADGQWVGTIQTMPCTLEQVAEDIARTGKSGHLRWNPISIQTPTGFLQPLNMIDIRIEAAVAEEGEDAPSAAAKIEAQIRKGSATRVATPVNIEGRGIMRVEIDLDLWPPFVGV